MLPFVKLLNQHSKWQKKDGSIVSFKDKDDLEVGVDVSDEIAEDMLRCDYAIAKSGQPRIETKTEKDIKVSVEDITSNMGKKDLELYARGNLGIELDRRKGFKALHAEVIEAIKEKNNE